MVVTGSVTGLATGALVAGSGLGVGVGVGAGGGVGAGAGQVELPQTSTQLWSAWLKASGTNEPAPNINRPTVPTTTAFLIFILAPFIIINTIPRP